MSIEIQKRKRLKRGSGTILLLSAMILTLATWGCGGGGGGGSSDPPAPVTVTYNLSGTITAPAGMEIDGDVNDPNENYASNDTTPQEISNPVSLGGYVNVAGSGATGVSSATGDRDDYFRVDLNSGDRIFLSIGDTAVADLDLYILDSSGATLIDSSTGESNSESLPAPGDGNYIVNVYAYSGASNYILTIGPNTGGAAQDALSTEHDFLPGQAIVRFADIPQADASRRALSERAADLGMDMAAGGPGRAVLLTFDSDPQQNTVLSRALSIDPNARAKKAADGDLQAKLDTLQAIKALRKRPDVISAEPNYILHHYATPDDTHYGLQWHYPLINLPRAWDETTGSASVIVAVVDTGVLMNHPDLAGKLTTGYDFISNTTVSRDGDGIDSNPDDPGDSATPGASSFHGTHCAGTVAASTNNTAGMAGAGWLTKIMPVRVLGKGGGSLYDIMQGVLYAAGEPNDSGIFPAQTADIISMSLGGGSASSAAQAIFTQVRNKGIILIAAAGNESTSTPSYPASYDGVVSVSAVNINSTLASYSNYGAYIDVAAPGGDSSDLDGDGYQDLVWSTCGDDSSTTFKFNYCLKAGTSMATPHVAGVVALMKALRPGLTPNELDSWLITGEITNDIGTTGRDNLYGYGLIDAYKAVLKAQDNTTTTLLKADPVGLNFGMSATSATLTVSKIGSGSLSVDSVTIAPAAAWLSIAPSSVDADGFGTYTVQANRSTLTTGSYATNIILVPSSGSNVTVPVNLQFNTTSGTADAGFHYVLLVNADSFEAVYQANVQAVNGVYNFSFPAVGAGNYYLFAGSDRDNDSYIDNAGESLGAYPSLDQITAVAVNGNKSGLNFATDIKLFLPAAASATQTDDLEWSSLPPLKRIR